MPSLSVVALPLAGRDGSFQLYEDDGVTLAYTSGAFATIQLCWHDANSTLVAAQRVGRFEGMLAVGACLVGWAWADGVGRVSVDGCGLNPARLADANVQPGAGGGRSWRWHQRDRSGCSYGLHRRVAGCCRAVGGFACRPYFPPCARALKRLH